MQHEKNNLKPVLAKKPVNFLNFECCSLGQFFRDCFFVLGISRTTLFIPMYHLLYMSILYATHWVYQNSDKNIHILMSNFLGSSSNRVFRLSILILIIVKDFFKIILKMF